VIQKIKCFFGFHSTTVDSLRTKFVEDKFSNKYYLHFDVCPCCKFKNRYWNFAHELEDSNDQL